MYAKTTTANISSVLFKFIYRDCHSFFLGYSDKFSDLAQNFLTVNVVVDVKRIHNYRG